MRVNKCKGEACESSSHEEAAHVRRKAQIVEFQQRNRPDDKQEESQDPGSKMRDDDVDRRNQRECGVETAEVESSGACR